MENLFLECIAKDFSNDKIREEELSFLYERFIELYTTEAFVGKTKTILEIEKKITILTELMREDKLGNYTNHPVNKQLEKLICKQFGFKEVCMMWTKIPEELTNAFTIAPYCVTIGNVRNQLENRSNYGYYDSGHNIVLYVNASSQLPKICNLTGEELTAILLHEIGHNFDLSPYRMIQLYIALYVPIVELIKDFKEKLKSDQYSLDEKLKFLWTKYSQFIQFFFLTSNIGKKTASEIQRLVDSAIDQLFTFIPHLKDLCDIGLTIYDKVKTAMSFYKMIDVFKRIPKRVLLSPVYQYQNLIIKKQEEFADSFSAMYGYAVPLATGLDKLHRIQNFKDLDKIHKMIGDYDVVVRLVTDLTVLERDLIETLMANHGTVLTRTVINLNYLKKELKTQSIPAPVRKELEMQISELEKATDILVNSEREGTRLEISRILRLISLKIFRGRTDYLAALFPDNTVS